MLGLPLLNAMGRVRAEASPAAAASRHVTRDVQAPVRMACLYFPNGVWEKTWFPEAEGSSFTLPFALEPLANQLEERGCQRVISHRSPAGQ